MTDRTVAPSIIDAVNLEVNLLPVHKFVLDNDTPLYFLSDKDSEVVNVEWVFNGGNLYEVQDNVSLATCSLLKNGTRSMSAYQLTEKLEYYGAFFQVGFGHEVVTLTLSCLSKHVNNLLPIVREIISESVFREEELDIFKQNSLQRLSVNLKKSEYIADNLVNELIYGSKHPYARALSESNIKALDRENILQFFSKYFAKGYCQIFAVGGLVSGFELMMNRVFGDLEFAKVVAPDRPVVSLSTDREIRKEVDSHGLQGAVRMCRAFPGRNHPDFITVSVLNTLFGGYFGSRLMNNIREEKGYTYGIYSYVQSHLDAGAWVITTEAGKDVCNATIKEVYHEMNILREEVVDADELDLVKNYLLGIYLTQVDGPFKTMARWKALITKDWDETHFYETIRNIKEISANEIQALAQKYFTEEEFKEIVVV